MKAALVVTGREIVTGLKRDALIQPFACELKSCGAEVAEIRVIGDSPDSLWATLSELAMHHDLVVVSGGLGATPDDTTATVIEGLKQRAETCAAIANPVGSAQGVDLDLGGVRIVFLPGVPRESLVMIKTVAASLKPGVEQPVRLTAFGLGENRIAEMLGEVGQRVSYLPRDMEIELIVQPADEAAVRAILGEHVLAAPSLAEDVGQLLKRRGLTVGTAESCTGGLVGHLLTEVAGSSDYYLGGVVSYANQVKTGLLGVEADLIAAQGAVSAAVARAMLRGVLQTTGADVGLALTGVAGPGGGSAEKPVGLVWIAVGSVDEQLVTSLKFGFDRAGNKQIFAKSALALLRKFLNANPGLHRG
ncbi:MAG: Nicotinamide-nucleotide amidohydrolase PncC [Deltaproteobacteria bacterium ADurb.Bin510]|nr:MAG: Nicotinamide-nucleotide amidohydrolase PncC [Deltaproteobacteria bacterium ADurb.Bin510]